MDDLTKIILHNTALSTSERVVVGYCPQCANVLILTNDGSVWGLMTCSCGFIGSTNSVLDSNYYDPIYHKQNERINL